MSKDVFNLFLTQVVTYPAQKEETRKKLMETHRVSKERIFYNKILREIKSKCRW